MKWLLITIALGFVVVFLLLPLVNVFWQSLAHGLAVYWESLIDSDTRSAIKLTLLIAGISGPAQPALWSVRSLGDCQVQLQGQADAHLAHRPALCHFSSGCGPDVRGPLWTAGFFGEWLDTHEIKIIFAVPGMVLATVFITFPFVARELIPVMEATGTEQEQAALTLGASGWQTFWHVTLPSVRWGCFMGSSFAMRAPWVSLAPFRSCPATSPATDTMPLRVEKLYQGASAASMTAAFAVASLLALLALITLVIKHSSNGARSASSLWRNGPYPRHPPLAPSIQVPSRQQ